MSTDYDLLLNAKIKGNSYYVKNGAVYLNFGGDGLYLFDIKSNRKNTFAEQICEILNMIPKDRKIKK